MVVVDIFDKKLGIQINYYLDKRLKKNFDDKIIPSLQKKDKDCIIALDGNEGSGKSTLALQIGKYCDPTLDLTRIVFSAEEFRNAIYKAKKGQCIIYDEAFTGLSSRSALSGINKALVGLMMQMRQKNLLIIIVLPTFYLLDKYVALFRTRALIHVYEHKGERGFFRLYNRKLKKYLYLKGAKTMTYSVKGVFSKFNGRFRGKFALGDPKLEEEYRKKKGRALEDTEKTSLTSSQVKYKSQRDAAIYLLKKKLDLPWREMEKLLSEVGCEISYIQLMQLGKKFGDKLEEEDEKFLLTQQMIQESGQED